MMSDPKERITCQCLLKHLNTHIGDENYEIDELLPLQPASSVVTNITIDSKIEFDLILSFLEYHQPDVVSIHTQTP
jgi:hypothetical protein